MNRSFRHNLYELFSSMRFAISLLTILAIASAIGTVLKQGEAYNAYLNQFGPFWFGIFERLGLYAVYHAGWFLTILAFLVISTSLCILRQAPQMLHEMRTYREHAKESSLRQFAHRAELATALSVEQAGGRIEAHLRQQGYQTRRNARAGALLIAAKAGSWNRLGYILAHSAIVTICIGGLLDGDLPLNLHLWLGNKQIARGTQSLDRLPPASRLPVDHWSYRGNIFVPEGKRADFATVNIGDGFLIQELPFDLILKKFHVDYYSTGAPKRFASDVVLVDKKTGISTARTIEVNKPFTYQGITLYQASFEDGGSVLRLKAHSLSPGSGEVLDLTGAVGDAIRLTRRDAPLTLELTNLRPINVENIGSPRTDTGNLLEKHLGSGAKSDRDLHNVGPSILFKLRDNAGQAREFNSYMLPIEQEGRRFFLAGVRDAQADDFRYMRIPADREGTMTTWFELRTLLTDPAARAQIARRFTAAALKGDAVSETLRSKLSDTTEHTLGLYADGGYEGLDKFIRTTLPAAEQQKAAEVFVKVLQGAAWEALQLSREQRQLAPWPMDGISAAFINDSLNAISDSFHYGAPVFIEMTGFDLVQASVIQATRSPGQYIVYLGCALLIAGVCFMLYVRERRFFALVKEDGSVLLAMSTNRKTLDFEETFVRHRDQLQQLLTLPESDHGTHSG
ncbi:MAG: cytochrome c biogenesis protein ResB [Proteobacteria bacterium]|nr:cytochrome c biogenesis protein ResB [Pseudomonadota bacterium]HQR04913.1 cytochrome c biogenesis protein ResB [Rhodocyclaceae bacterium]